MTVTAVGGHKARD